MVPFLSASSSITVFSISLVTSKLRSHSGIFLCSQKEKEKKIWQIITWRGTCLHIFPSQSLRCSDICARGLKRIRARNKNPGRSAEQLFGYTHALTLCPPFLPSFRDADAERWWERKLHASWGLAIGAGLQMQSVACLVSTSGKRQGYDQIRPAEEAFKGWF